MNNWIRHRSDWSFTFNFVKSSALLRFRPGAMFDWDALDATARPVENATSSEGRVGRLDSVGRFLHEQLDNIYGKTIGTL